MRQRRRDGLRRGWMDRVKEDMRTTRVTEEDARDRARWMRTIRTGDPRVGHYACRRRRRLESCFIFHAIKSFRARGWNQGALLMDEGSYMRQLKSGKADCLS